MSWTLDVIPQTWRIEAVDGFTIPPVAQPIKLEVIFNFSIYPKSHFLIH